MDIFQYIPNLSLLYPEIIVTVLALMVLIADLVVSKKRKVIIAVLAILGLLVALLSCIPLLGVNKTTFSGMFICDPFAMS